MTAVESRIRLCVLDEVPLGLGRSFQVGENLVAVFRTRNGRVFATDGICPHKGGPLADGMLGTDDQVVCPYHTFRFDSSTGVCDQSTVCSIETYPVEVINRDVFITV